MDADTLSHLPLVIDSYVEECIEPLGRAVRHDIAYVASLNLTQSSGSQMKTPLPTISHSELLRAQREDVAISQLKEARTVLTNKDRRECVAL